MPLTPKPYADIDAQKCKNDTPLDIFARPASGFDVDFMMGVLQSYGTYIAGANFAETKRFLESQIKRTMVAVVRAGEMVGFGINAPHPDMPDRTPVLMVYNRQNDAAVEHVHSIIRGFSLTALARNVPTVSLMADFEDATMKLALADLGARIADPTPRNLRTLSGLSCVMQRYEIDRLAEKFTRKPASP